MAQETGTGNNQDPNMTTPPLIRVACRGTKPVELDGPPGSAGRTMAGAG